MGQTPLIIASYWGKDEALRLLIDAKGDINAQNEMGNTALHHIAENAKPGWPLLPAMLRCTTSLLDAKANPRLRNGRELQPLDICQCDELRSQRLSTLNPSS